MNKEPSVNSGYAALKLAQALAACEEHADPEARQLAARRVASWNAILENIFLGSAAYGSRTPINNVPAWATLEVATGGFATGKLLAGGSLEVFEQNLLAKLPAQPEGAERSALNMYFLTDAGLAELLVWLRTGRFVIRVPEEGALLVVAWLATNWHTDAAREIINTISPFFSKLRFYPVPDYRDHHFGQLVHVQDVGATIGRLRRIKPNDRVLAQKMAAQSWAPLYDNMVGLFAETLVDDWPCQQRSDDWSSRARTLLAEHAKLRNACNAQSKYCKPGSHYLQLRDLLEKCERSFDTLTSKDVGRVRLIIKRSIEKRGLPFSSTSCELRSHQLHDVRSPLHADIAKIVDSRLTHYQSDEGIDNVDEATEPVTADEATNTVPAGTAIPRSIRRKVGRCLNETIEMLLRRGLISSAETLAKVLPQLSSGVKSLGISDPVLRQLYTSIYRAFRSRRSLLLLNLEKQVQIEELPWVAEIERFRDRNLSNRETSRQVLEEIALLTLEFFPHTILPNKLVRELGALAEAAGINMPLVEEIASDIFMGQFSGKFLEASNLAGGLLRGSLYAVYFNIDYDELASLRLPPARQSAGIGNDFALICAARAGVSVGSWNSATNGMIIEQQQILTTQNLATLVVRLGLRDALEGRFEEMAKSCFRWICKRNQIELSDWHAKLTRVKNTAYAWRQMIFFLSLLRKKDVRVFLEWADKLQAEQTQDWQERFSPALNGLKIAAAGYALDSSFVRGQNARCFLGWSRERHWILS